MRVLPGIAACAAVLAVAAGCGVTEEQTHPGVAAEVGGQTLQLRTLDDAVADYCAGLAKIKQAETSTLASVRAGVTLTWMQSIALQHLATEYHVDFPDENIEQHEVDEIFDAFGVTDDTYDSFEVLTLWLQRTGQPMIDVGRAYLAAQGHAQVSDDQAHAQGKALVEAWLADHKIEINPVFGAFNQKDQTFAVGNGLSVPVSGEARKIADAADPTKQAQVAVPRSQQCGPGTPAAGAPQAG